MSPSAASSEPSSGLSTHQANQMYWLTGMAPMATNLVTPLMVFWRMRSMPKPLMVKYNQQVNEVGRQFIGGSIGLLSYFGGGELTRGLLKALGWHKTPDSKNESNQQVGMMLGGTVMNFLGFAIVRPLISTPIICKFLKKEGQQQALTAAQVDQLMQAVHGKGNSMVDASQRLSFLETEMRKLDQDATQPQKVDGFPIRNMQRWIDTHLFDTASKTAKPLLGKTAAVATVALSIWFAGLSSSLYLLNRALGKSKSIEANSAPLPVLQKPLPLMMPSYSPLFSRMASVPPLPATGSTAANLYPYGF